MTDPMQSTKLLEALNAITDDELSSYKFYSPQVLGGVNREEGGSLALRLSGVAKGQSSRYYKVIQEHLWEKFQENPWINTTVIDYTGRLTGRGFEVTSPIYEIREFINSISNDIRNCLYRNISKFVARHRIEGELYLVLTVHESGFIEIDFLDPSTISGGDLDSGKFYHPTKPDFVLGYNINGVGSDGKTQINRVIPSINIAYLPELSKLLEEKLDTSTGSLEESRASSRKYKKIGGFKQFIIEFNTGLFTTRNVSSLRTTLEWINHYETLKKYEIDHKKASGAYLWVITVKDPKAFRTWLAMSDDERKKTGIMEQYVPGGKIILPPGLDMKALNPTLPNISGSDTDILHMVTAGLNSPEDMITGQSTGPYSSVKASRAPQSDRISDSVETLEKFLRFDFWRPIMYLSSIVSTFKFVYKVEEAIDFKNQEPVYKMVKRFCYELIEFNFPVSEISDVEAVARGILGVKHGSVIDTLDLPPSDVSKRMGFNNYYTARLRSATEKKRFPPTMPAVDQESQQEINQGEQPKDGVKKKPKIAIKKNLKKENKSE